jgi:hypothetical protein
VLGRVVQLRAIGVRLRRRGDRVWQLLRYKTRFLDVACLPPTGGITPSQLSTSQQLIRPDWCAPDCVSAVECRAAAVSIRCSYDGWVRCGHGGLLCGAFHGEPRMLQPLRTASGRVSRALPVHTVMRNSTRDEGGPFGLGDQEQSPSHCKLLRAKAVVVSVAIKVRTSVRPAGSREASASEPLQKRRKRIRRCRNRGVTLPAR